MASTQTDSAVLTIDAFNGDYRWLSNFSPMGGCFPTAEHHYQARKARTPYDAIYVMSAPTPNLAKHRGRAIHVREDWEEIKLDVMYDILILKFSIEPVQTMLIETGNAELIEGNTWGDTFWGVCKGKGDNYLGELLMCVREHYEIRGHRQ